jgi:hypothetical protein
MAQKAGISHFHPVHLTTLWLLVLRDGSVYTRWELRIFETRIHQLPPDLISWDYELRHLDRDDLKTQCCRQTTLAARLPRLVSGLATLDMSPLACAKSEVGFCSWFVSSIRICFDHGLIAIRRSLKQDHQPAHTPSPRYYWVPIRVSSANSGTLPIQISCARAVEYQTSSSLQLPCADCQMLKRSRGWTFHQAKQNK